MIRENFADREEIARETAEFLGRQLEDAKHNLDDLDGKMAAFKRRYWAVAGGPRTILKLLMALNSQLEATTQTLNRAQQDKAYAESLLAQQLAAGVFGNYSADPKPCRSKWPICRAS